jgi:hypothetical protein
MITGGWVRRGTGFDPIGSRETGAPVSDDSRFGRSRFFHGMYQTRNRNIPRRSVTTTLSLLLALLARVEFESLTL